MKIKVVCFDIDGTLYPQWKMLFHMRSSFLLDPILAFRFSKVRALIRDLDDERENLTDFRKAQAELVCGLYRKKFTVEKMEKRIENMLYKIWESSFRGLRPYWGVKPLLKMLQEKGVIVGALSDFPVQNKLRYMGLGNGLFSFALCTEECGYLKPHQKAFDYLIQNCGCDPSEILYVGNSYSKDVVGAKKAGMLSAHLTQKKVEDSIADLNFRDYSELSEKIKKIMID